MWADPDYRKALGLRVDEKISKAASYDCRNILDETWLVVSSQLRWGALGSTMIVPGIVKTQRLQHRRSNWSRQGREEWALPMAPFKVHPPGQNSHQCFGWRRHSPGLGLIVARAFAASARGVRAAIELSSCDERRTITDHSRLGWPTAY
jgi:hypothetical protein